ncbi:MAG TPA: RHS repeat-associated core domain-containing protein [Solirubrobacteraceae bacterium]
MSRHRHRLHAPFREGRSLVFALILCAAAIVLPAAGLAGPQPKDDRAPDRLAPADRALTEAVAGDRQRIAERRRELESPQAQERRRQTRKAFAALGADAAAEAARRHHASAVSERAWPEVHLDQGERVAGLDDEHTLRVSREHGPDTIVVTASSIAAAGDPQRLASLRLERRGDAFVPEAARVPLRIGGTVDEGVELLQAGLRLVPVTGAAAALGEKAGESVFYANTQTDADTIVRPLPSGVETFTQLRSEDSPETLAFRLDLPDGASLREKSGHVAAEIVDGERVLAHVLRPWAQDADGRTVDVGFEVQGSRLVLRVEHRGADVAYPILVDPEVVWDPNNTGPGSPLMGALWEWQTYGPGGLSPWAGNGYLGDGIYVRDLDGTDYGQRAEWFYRAPGDSIVQELDVWGLRNDMSTGASVCSHTGILSWIWGGWEAGPNRYCGDHDSIVYHEFFSPDNAGSPGNMAAFGMVVPDSAPRAYVATKADPWVYLWDDNAPSVTWLSSPDWTNDGNRAVQARISDGGLGVKTGQLSGPSGQLASSTATCSYNARCAQTMTLQKAISSFGEGVQTASASGQDLAKNNTSASTSTTRLDRVAPQRVDLSGPIYERRATSTADNGVFGGKHDLIIEAEDGTATDRRSGVRQFEVYVGLRLPDGSVGPETKYTTTPTTCNLNTYDCPRIHSDRWTFDTANHPIGRYRIRVVALDKPGNPAQAPTFDVVVSPVTTDALKDRPTRLGLEQFWQYDEVDTGGDSQAFVNLDTGNLVWHTIPILNPGRGLASVVNLDYNSQAKRDLAGLDYSQVGQGFSLSISGVTRLNEPLDLSRESGGIIEMTDADGTRHRFARNGDGVTYSPPAGVNLRLRQYQMTASGPSWIMTRPDGVTFVYGANGYLTSVVDRNDNRLLVWYETIGVASKTATDDGGTCGLPKQLSGADPRFVTNNSIVECRRVSSITDAAGRAVTISYYDPLPDLRLPGRVRRIQDHAGRVTEFRYDAEGYLTELVQALGQPAERSFQYEYEPVADGDLDRDMLRVRDPNGSAGSDSAAGWTDFSYIADPRTSLPAPTRGKWTNTVRNRRDNTRTYTPGTATANDPAGSVRTAKVTDARGYDTNYAIDGAGRVLSRTDARGTVTRLGWDADNNVTLLQEAFGTADFAQATMAYNANGLLTRRTDPENHVTTLTYRDGAGRWQSEINAPGKTTPADAGGTFVSDLKEIKTPLGHIWAYGLDANGNVTTRTDPEGGVFETKYLANGNVDWEKDEVGAVTDFNNHDNNGLPREQIDARANRSVDCYNSVGKLVWSADPRGAAGVPADCSTEPTRYFARYTYDELDRQKTERLPRLSAGSDDAEKFSTRSWEYDDNGNLTRMVDANGNDRLTAYTPMDHQLTVDTPAVQHSQSNVSLEAAPARERTSYEYDAEDNATKVTSPNGNVTANVADDSATKLVYDAIGQRTAEVRMSRGPDRDLISSFAYDRRGNVVGVADPRHNAGQTPDQAVTRVQTEANRRLTYQYDRSNNLRFQIDNPAQGAGDADTWSRRQTEHRYDADDNRVATIEPRGFRDGNDPNQYLTRYEYDDTNRPLATIDPTGARSERRYRANGQLAGETKPRGAATTTAGDFETTYDYYPTGELRTLTLPRSAVQYGPTWSVTYTRNEVGDPTSVTDARGNTFTNTFYDTGEVRSTTRPGYWRFAGPGAEPPQDGGPDVTGAGDGNEVVLRDPRDLDDAAQDEEPTADNGAHGDMGELEQQKRPDILPRAGATTMAYEREMRLTRVTDSAGDATTLCRDALGRVLQTNKPRDVTAAPADDCRGQGDGNQPPPGYITEEFVHDFNGNVRSARDGGHATLNTYDQFGRLVTRSIPGSLGGLYDTTNWTYDENDNVTFEQRPNGHTWQRIYDVADRMTELRDPLANRTTYGLDAIDNVTSERRPEGNATGANGASFTTTSLFNRRGELYNQRDGQGNVTSFEYDLDGNTTKVDAPNDTFNRLVTETEYDGRGLPWRERVVESSPRTTITQFDGNGNLRRTVRPAGVDEATRTARADDPQQNAVPVTSDYAWNAEVRQYDADDQLTAIHQPWGGTDARRFRTDFTYDTRGRSIAVDTAYDWSNGGATTARTTYTHWDSGWIRTQSEPQIVDPDTGVHYAQTITYEYDMRGNQLYWASNKREICNQYGPNSLVIKRSATPTNAGRKCKNNDPNTAADDPLRVYAYSYDHQRQITSMTDQSIKADGTPDRTNGRTTTYGYDPADRPTSTDETWSGGLDTQLFYDRDGNVTERRTDGAITGATTYSGGRTTFSTYDSLDRERTNRVRTPTATITAGYLDRTTTMTYTPSGELSTIDKPNGDFEQRSYDSAGRLSYMDRTAAGKPKQQSYSYDRNGNRSEDEHGRYTFNARDQLVRWERGLWQPRTGVVDYTLNGNGAVTEKRDSYDGSTRRFVYFGDRLESIRDASGSIISNYKYNDDASSAKFGQLKEIATGSKTETFTFDEFDRMTTYASGGTTRRYAYDGMDRRDARYDDATSQTAAVDYSYIGGTELLSRERRATRTDFYDYTADGERIGQTSQASNGALTPVSYGKDANGNVETVGTGRCRYGESQDCYFDDPYGNQEGADNQLSTQAQNNPFRFQGHYRDAESGMYDMRARQYRPEAGGFLQSDRYEAANLDFSLQSDLLTQNRYAFAGGNPVTNVEFDGHFGGMLCAVQRLIDRVLKRKQRKCHTGRTLTDEELAILEANADFLANRVGRVERADPEAVRARPGFKYAVVGLSTRRVSTEGARLLTSIDPKRNPISRKLFNVIASNYRFGAKIGPKGSTADAIYAEVRKAGGKIVGKHVQKGRESVEALEDILAHADKLTPREIQIAQRTLNQLKDALKGRPPRH